MLCLAIFNLLMLYLLSKPTLFERFTNSVVHWLQLRFEVNENTVTHSCALLIQMKFNSLNKIVSHPAILVDLTSTSLWFVQVWTCLIDRHRFTLWWMGTLLECKPIGSAFNCFLPIGCYKKSSWGN